MDVPRIHGLDTLRALAVSLVVLHHYTLFVSDAPTFGWVGTMGWAGVDLFFALSGYLIGNQIFAALGSARGFGLARFSERSETSRRDRFVRSALSRVSPWRRFARAGFLRGFVQESRDLRGEFGHTGHGGFGGGGPCPETPGLDW